MRPTDAPAEPSDQLLPFLFERRAARGAIVRIESGIEAMFGGRRYPAPVRRLLSQAVAAMPLLGSHLKRPGQLNLQFQGGRHLPLLVAQADHRLNLRAMAKLSGDSVPETFAELMAGGQLAVLMEPEDGPRYQALVDVRGASLAEALEGYFLQSEQLPTRLLLAADASRIAGLMLQQMPGPNARDDWAHASALVDTLGEVELLDTAPETVLHRLFHGDALRMLEARAVHLGCNCSHAGISRLLIGMGREELSPVLDEQGQVEVTCEFCGAQYAYTAAEVAALFAAAEAEPDGARH